MTPVTQITSSISKDDAFKFYKPHTRGNAARITDEQWEPHFLLIQQLHNARKTRVQILDVLRGHGLEPSVAQLYAKMSRWGLKGYGTGVKAGDDGQVDNAGEPTSNCPVPADRADNVLFSMGGDPGDLSEDSQISTEPSDCFSSNDVDTSDTMYESDDKLLGNDCDDDHDLDDEDVAAASIAEFTALDTMMIEPEVTSDGVDIDTMSVTSSIDLSPSHADSIQRLPSDLMHFVFSSIDVDQFDKHDILNEVACFLCTTNSFSDAFVLFDATHSFLKENEGGALALVFATINCLRSATFKEQCQYAGALVGEALAALRILSYSDPYTETAFSCLEQIGRELSFKSELENLNILYSQIQFNQVLPSSNSPSDIDVNACLLHCSDPFLVTGNRSQFQSHSLEVNNIALGRIIGKLSRWCAAACEDFNPIEMLPSAGFNPLDPISVARFATALSCHFIRKWSFLSLSEVLGHCNELLPPNRKDAGIRLCKLAVRILSMLATYAVYQATGVMQSVSEDHSLLLESIAQYSSPLAIHLDTLSRMKGSERVLAFAETNKTLYNRSLTYRQKMDNHCLMAYVRETGFLLADSLIRFKRELSIEVPRPASIISWRPTSPAPSTVPSRRGSDASSSMQNLVRRNLLVPGLMSKNGSRERKSWTRRLSTDSNESWNFTKVTGFPAGPSPPGSIRGEIMYNDGMDDCDEMTGMDFF